MIGFFSLSTKLFYAITLKYASNNPIWSSYRREIILFEVFEMFWKLLTQESVDNIKYLGSIKEEKLLFNRWHVYILCWQEFIFCQFDTRGISPENLLPSDCLCASLYGIFLIWLKWVFPAHWRVGSNDEVVQLIQTSDSYVAQNEI